MSFDASTYQILLNADPAAAAAYLQASTGTSSLPAATTPPPAAAAQPQAQGQFYSNPAAVQPAPVLARGTLEDFYNQPTGGGGGPSVTSKFFNKRVNESWLDLLVSSDVTNADVRQQTDPSGKPQTFKDGRPKFVLIVKVQVLGSSDGTHVAEFPDGLGSIWVKGELADELRRSMAAAGDASGYPKAGARLVMQSNGERASRTVGFNATKLYKLDYAPPAAPVDPTQTASATATSEPPATAVNPPAPSPASVPPTTPGAPAISTVTTPSATASTPPPPPSVGGRSKEELLASLGGSQ